MGGWWEGVAGHGAGRAGGKGVLRAAHTRRAPPAALPRPRSSPLPHSDPQAIPFALSPSPTHPHPPTLTHPPSPTHPHPLQLDAADAMTPYDPDVARVPELVGMAMSTQAGGEDGRGESGGCQDGSRVGGRA